MTTTNYLYNYCLRLGDNALILGHRLSELCSKAPFIEEDLALTNISLDMIGRAQAMLKYAAEVEGKGNNEDHLAYRRAEINYYNHLIVEQPNGDFAHTIVRQLFVSAFELYMYSELEKSKDATLAAIASKTVKEVRYHLEHASDWVIRLGDGTPESHHRTQKAINELWMYTGELFEMDEVEMALLHEGIAVDLVPVKAQWHNHLKNVLSEATMMMPEDGYMQTGSRKGIHTENLGHILSEMQYLQRAYPDATW
ncbi:MAG: phenylacetate-CoA oxygenase subunit PaaC [Bacteroidia bacterium]|nr:phenylacetate-CoA oxygenase subunit PaaC [Bacteroidia bacterium]